MAHQQQLLQQRTAAMTAAALNNHHQLVNNHGHHGHHQVTNQRTLSNNPHHQNIQHHQHGRPPGRPHVPANHSQSGHLSRNGPPTNSQQQQRPHPNNPAQPRSQSQTHSHHNERPTGQQTQPAQPPPLPPPLPKGWKREEVLRKKGASAGLVDVVYFETNAPEKKFRSKLQMQRHFGDKHDMSLLDFRTGKIVQHVYKKHRRLKGMAANPSNYTLAAKYDLYLNIPTRQTASIFKQNVHYVTNNARYNNEPTPSFVSDFQANSAQAIAANLISQNQLGVLSRKPTGGDRARPCQLFWELRFNGLKSIDAADLDSSSYKPIDFDLVNLSKFKNLNISNETALRSVAVSWYLNPNKPLLGQDKEFIRNPRIFIDRDQPLIPAITIKDDDIKQQEKRIKDIREKIRQAMSDLETIDREENFSPFDDDELTENGPLEAKTEAVVDDEIVKSEPMDETAVQS